ncbi:MAG: tetratricopeptide repeat protein [Clostridia bacterium]|nr:tetratricopeptide repeat protein [Clostridia bacterium]
MGIMDVLKIRKAVTKQQKGDIQGALEDYEALYGAGVVNVTYMLPYAVILLKKGGEENYLKVKEILRKAEKAPNMTPEYRQQLLMDYAVANYKLGEMDKALQLLEATHKKSPCGLTYQSLGFLYIQAGDTEKALQYNLEAVEYDDEDPICLDNLAQVYYRLLGDKDKALEYFKKAHEIKPKQIDTLYFLAKYDMEAGRYAEAKEKLQTALEGNFSPLNYATPDLVRELLQQLP